MKLYRQQVAGTLRDAQALAKWGLNYVINDYLPKKLANENSFLP
jgi:DNA topoisomerase VI subunit A